MGQPSTYEDTPVTPTPAQPAPTTPPVIAPVPGNVETTATGDTTNDTNKATL